MKIDPKGKTPPSGMMTRGSMNHFFSGIGLKNIQARCYTKNLGVLQIVLY